MNVLSESRALLSWTTTFLNNFRRLACACLSVLPSRRQAPYAAMMFHRAPPDVNGFGVTTSTPGFRRSFHDLMFFGFPSRRTNTTTESVTMPLWGFFVQPLNTSPALTRSSTSGASDSATRSAFRPAFTARACSPDEPYACEKDTSLPAAVFWNIGISCAYASRGVEYATSRSSVSAFRAGAVGARRAAP